MLLCIVFASCVHEPTLRKLTFIPFKALAGGHDEHGEEEAAPGDGLTDEQMNVFKGLTALIGIFIFFFIERMMTIITDIKRKRREVCIGFI